MSAFQVGRRDDILGTIGVGDETVEAVAAMQALDGVVEPSKSGKMLTACRWLQQRFQDVAPDRRPELRSAGGTHADQTSRRWRQRCRTELELLVS